MMELQVAAADLAQLFGKDSLESQTVLLKGRVCGAVMELLRICGHVVEFAATAAVLGISRWRRSAPGGRDERAAND